MKKIALLLLLTACAARPHFGPNDYGRVNVGSSIASVMEEFGDPDDVEFRADDKEEYLYIDRIQVAPGLMEHVHYVLLVDEGVVVDKEIRRTEQLPIEVTLSR